MKRTGNLYDKIAELDNINLAFIKAVRGKQFKKEVIEFRKTFDYNISELRNNILNETYTVDQYTHFVITDPKKREILAPTFNENILHHAIMNVCHPHFEKRLIFHIHGTRKGKGTYSAIDSAMKFINKSLYVAKLDFRHYYNTINHDILKSQLKKIFKDTKLLRLFSAIIDSYETKEGQGIPIGNLTSQYFANTYLSGLDHYVTEKLHPTGYVRYMDDIIVTANNIEQLRKIVHYMNEYSTNKLQITLKPPIINRTEYGILFLGYKIFKHHITLSGRSKRRYRTKLKTINKLYLSNKISEDEYKKKILPLTAFTMHANSWKFRHSCLKAIGCNSQGL